MTPPVPERAALFLDFDGTLVEIADKPDGVEVAEGLPPLIERLVERLGGAVAVVTGRKLADIDRFLALPIAAAGLHGLERRAAPGESIITEPPPPEIATLRERITGSGLIGEGVTMEDKGAGLAVHYRAAPQRGEEVARTMGEAVADLDRLQLIHGKMVVEAKRKGRDKGAAVMSFMAAAPFKGRTPVFIGDDVTDEDGIRAANQAGGFGVKVGEGETAAAHRLPDVEAVHAWLAELAEASR